MNVHVTFILTSMSEWGERIDNAGFAGAKSKASWQKAGRHLEGMYMRFSATLRALSATAAVLYFASPSIVEAQTAPETEPSSQPALPQPPNSNEPDIIVTAQKREQKIQDVPIAISAFSGKSLDEMKIEGGPDLLKSIPNVTFSKNNFSGYNFEIRGIGTKAVAVSTDPAVAVAFNSSTLITNRLFEQEFYDIERVEVLRGPQGTLYGRNATAGVVNVISNKADLDKFGGNLKLEVGNFDTQRLSGAINIPLIDDRLAIRAAGAYTKRSGFDYNDLTNQRINGRDLWSGRVTVTAKPVDGLRLDFIYEHFDENDDRQRAGKQLCHRDDGIGTIGGVTLTANAQGQLSQGCKDGSLYVDSAYGTPNGRSLPAYYAHQLFFGGVTLDVDPYGDVMQSKNLREFSAVIDPRYRAKADTYEFDATIDLGAVSLISQTTYNNDRYASSEDYNRYASQPIFQDTPITPGGVYTDPQLGASSLLVGEDLIRSKSEQFSQEVRLQSNDPTSKFQYVAGGNYTHYKNSTDYFVYFNALTALAQTTAFNNSDTISGCNSLLGPTCFYIDPNPIGQGPSDGHNYFRSSNPYRLTSFGAFADASYALTPTLKLIAGLRDTDDRKAFDQIPSQLLLGTSPLLAGFVDSGYPSVGTVRQEWNEVTGRAGLEWRPQLGFTDATMIYATYSRGYKAGGANPPGVGFGTATGGYGDPTGTSPLPPLPSTYRPEFISSYEIGVKNTLLGGKLTFDMTGFFYDYKDYQVSKIVDRSAYNENFGATVWGLEFETVWHPLPALRFNANLGYQRTRLKNGSQSIDVLNRTQGNPDYAVVKPFVQLPSNCVVNKAVIERVIAQSGTNDPPLYNICQGTLFADPSLIDPANYPDIKGGVEALYPNGGQGFYANVSGNELPNAPHLTFNIGADYTLPLGGAWVAIGRVDHYRQSESWARIYNTPGDRLHGWSNTNLSLRIANPKDGFMVEAYVKNVFNQTPIVDAFLNSDDTGLTTNVFTLDPRTIGLAITKSF